jgi:alpha-glucosidase
VPLPWTADGPSFGFGTGTAHLPQPSWFGRYAAARQDGDPTSTLTLYREALALRRRLSVGTDLTWISAADDTTLHFRRPDGWLSVTNFGPSAVPLPSGDLLLASGPLDHAFSPPALPADTTAWLRMMP